jgi:hypothetical protein
VSAGIFMGLGNVQPVSAGILVGFVRAGILMGSVSGGILLGLGRYMQPPLLMILI